MKSDQNSYPLLVTVYIYTITLEVWLVVSIKVEHLQYLLFFKDMTLKMLANNFLLNSSRYHYGIVKENSNKKWCTQVLITFCPLPAGWTGASLSLSFRSLGLILYLPQGRGINSVIVWSFPTLWYKIHICWYLGSSN